MKGVVKWRELEAELNPSDLGIEAGTPVSVNLDKNRVLVKENGGYKFVGLSKEARKLVLSVLRSKKEVEEA